MRHASRGVRRRPAIVPAPGILLILLLAGCGSQDRLEVVHEPEAIMGVVSGARLTALPRLLAGIGANATDAWEDGRVALGGDEGLVLIAGDDDVRPVPLPAGADNVVGVSCRPDGAIWAVTRDGDFAAWDGDSWSIESTGLESPVRGLLVDESARPLAWLDNRIVRRDAPGAWTVVVVLDADAFRAAWSHPEAGAVLATRHGVVHEIVAGVPHATTLEPDAATEFLAVGGDGTGRLAVAIDNDVVWLREDGAWTRHARTGGIYHIDDVFWRDGRPCLAENHRLLRWDGEWWQDDMTLPSSSTLRVLQPGGRLLVVKTLGGVIDATDGEPRWRTPNQDGFTGFAREDDRWCVLASNSVLWEVPDAGDRVWRFELLPHWDDTYIGTSSNDLARDEHGRLIACLDRSVAVRESGGWVERFVFSESIRWSGQLPGGGCLIVTRSGVHRFGGGTATAVATGWPFVNPLAALAVESDAVYVVDDDALLRFGPDGGSPLWTAVGWSPRSLCLYEGGFVVGGRLGARLVSEGVVSDLTPWRPNGRTLEAASTEPLIALADGRLLAWDATTRTICLRDVGGWNTLEFAGGDGPRDLGLRWCEVLVEWEDGVLLGDADAAVLLDLGGLP